ncbi:MAG: hypothetical protein CM1200mP30_20680 [Pseudomonadota bacterium]|nr:MAG: hypothetical protein CM1200mP30_20680 [Pseudomonadota bacterium]
MITEKGLSDSFIKHTRAWAEKLAPLFPTKPTKLISLLRLLHWVLPEQTFLQSSVTWVRAGKHIIQGSLDAGSFDKFIFADGMYGESLLKNMEGGSYRHIRKKCLERVQKGQRPF